MSVGLVNVHLCTLRISDFSCMPFPRLMAHLGPCCPLSCQGLICAHLLVSCPRERELPALPCMDVTACCRYSSRAAAGLHHSFRLGVLWCRPAQEALCCSSQSFPRLQHELVSFGEVQDVLAQLCLDFLAWQRRHRRGCPGPA